MNEYRKRIGDGILAGKLSYIGAVLVEGPKWCGKTTTCEQHAQSVLYIDDPGQHGRPAAVGEYAYGRKDGVIVCPISALKP